jgi:NAD(P)-dependent dehydrogenase (short-subunit alcohol dehydrogenase family)
MQMPVITMKTILTCPQQTDPCKMLDLDWIGRAISVAMAEAGFHRLAGILNVELGEKGIRAFGLQPGMVTTEALMATLGENSEMATAYGSAPPEVPAAVIRWLATKPDANEFLGKTVHAQNLARKKGLVPGWPPAETA